MIHNIPRLLERRELTELADFNINELMLFVIGVLGAFGALAIIIQKSKCEEINCCCIKCKRDVSAVLEEERIKRNIKKTISLEKDKIKPPPITNDEGATTKGIGRGGGIPTTN